MANFSFTRDEVILALDVLYSAGNQSLNAQSSAIIELSDILNKLPIHPVELRKKNFRTPSGILKQILTFKRSYSKQIKDVYVGYKFYEVAFEFQNRQDELHEIANAIRRNTEFYSVSSFGSHLEAHTFPEGALLGHLHCLVETRDSIKIVPGTRCDICKIDTRDIYSESINLMTMHLTVPITEIDGNKRYKTDDFITVCPNCHAALHRIRPWLIKGNCEKIIG